MNSTNARMRQVLVEMTMISEAGAAQLGDVIHGGEKNNAPRGPRLSMADEHLRDYMRARTRQARRQALQDAEEALIAARISPRREHIPGTLEWRVAIARAEGTVEQVSIVYGCSRSTVYRLREKLGEGLGEGGGRDEQARQRAGSSVGDDATSPTGRSRKLDPESGNRSAVGGRYGKDPGPLERVA